MLNKESYSVYCLMKNHIVQRELFYTIKQICKAKGKMK